MLTVKCNHCDIPFRCAPELAGEQVACPHCEAHVRVPFDAPNLDAIKKRAESKVQPIPAAQPKAKTEAVAEKPPQQDEVIQASVHDLFVQQRVQHAALTERINTLHKELASLNTRLRNVSLQVLAIVLLLSVTCLSVTILTIVFLMKT